MKLFVTPGRVKSYIGVPGPGGYKVYLTDGSRQWVELGGGGATGNPHGLFRQPQRGFDFEVSAYEFARELLSSHAAVAQNPLAFHRLYSYAPTGELYYDRSTPLERLTAKAATADADGVAESDGRSEYVEPATETREPSESMLAQKVYTLVGTNGRPYQSTQKASRMI